MRIETETLKEFKKHLKVLMSDHHVDEIVMIDAMDQHLYIAEIDVDHNLNVYVPGLKMIDEQVIIISHKAFIRKKFTIDVFLHKRLKMLKENPVTEG